MITIQFSLLALKRTQIETIMCSYDHLHNLTTSAQDDGTEELWVLVEVFSAIIYILYIYITLLLHIYYTMLCDLVLRQLLVLL